MNSAFEKLRERLEIAFRNARAVYEADKGKSSEAFDSGRYDGLKEALAILDECEPKADTPAEDEFRPLKRKINLDEY